MTAATNPSPPPGRDRAAGRILGSFLLIAAILAAVAVGSVRNINRSVATSDWVNHTHAVILEVNEILADLEAANGAALAYSTDRDPRSKEIGRAALDDLAEQLTLAKALTRNEPSQHGEILDLEAAADKVTEWDWGILSGDKASVALLDGDAGYGAMAKIRATVQKLKDEEMALLDARDRASFVQAQTTRRMVWAGVAVDLLLLGGVAWLICDDLRARRAAAQALAEANAQLESKVRERTAELAAANAQLRSDNIERKWANQALEHQLRYNQVVLNSIDDLMFVVTKAMNISRINSAVVRLSGFESEELVNQPLSSIVRLAEESGEAPGRDPIARALADGRDLRDRPAVVAAKGGQKVPVRLALFPLRDQDKVVGGVAIIHHSPPLP